MNSLTVRFIENCRDGISWFKGDIGIVKSQIAWRPMATSDIFIIKVRNRDVWATREDIQEWNQLSLF